MIGTGGRGLYILEILEEEMEEWPSSGISGVGGNGLLYLSLEGMEVCVWWGLSGVDGRGRCCLATKESGTRENGPLEDLWSSELRANGGGWLCRFSVGATA